MIYTVQIDHPALKAEAVHYASMPYSWVVYIMEAPDGDEALRRWFRFLMVALMNDEAQEKLGQASMSEVREIVGQYLENPVYVQDWELEK